jgi:hypothetical protein
VSPQVKIRRVVAHTSAGPLTGYHSPRLAEGPDRAPDTGERPG